MTQVKNIETNNKMILVRMIKVKYEALLKRTKLDSVKFSIVQSGKNTRLAQFKNLAFHLQLLKY